MTQELTDSEIAMFWAGHYNNPCGFEKDGERYHIREFYRREIKERVIPKLTNPEAIKFLELTISTN